MEEWLSYKYGDENIMHQRLLFYRNLESRSRSRSQAHLRSQSLLRSHLRLCQSQLRLQPRTRIHDKILHAIYMFFLLMRSCINGSFSSVLSLIIACLPFSVGAVVLDPRPSTRHENYTNKYFSLSHHHDKLTTPTVKKNWIQGKTTVDWTDIIMFIGIVFLVVAVYYHQGVVSAFCVFWIYITNLMQMLKKTMKQAWIKRTSGENIKPQLKKNNIKYLGAEFRLSTIALSSPFLEGPENWKASMVAGIAAFAIIIYCGKVSVELKRAEVTTIFYSETRNNKKVLFFTATHVLEFLIPLLYSLLACVYLTKLDTKNHHTENDWGSVAFSLQVFIHVIGGLLAFMNDRNPYYFRHNDQNQIVPMQPIDTIPRKGNEIFLKDKLVVAEEISEEVADVNVLVVVEGFVENQCADGSVSEVTLVVAEELSEEVADVHV